MSVGDVAPVLAQMRRDAVRPGGGGHVGGPYRIGMMPAAGVTDGGDVVDVDAEAQAGHGLKTPKEKNPWAIAQTHPGPMPRTPFYFMNKRNGVWGPRPQAGMGGSP